MPPKTKGKNLKFTVRKTLPAPAPPPPILKRLQIVPTVITAFTIIQ